MLLSDGHENEGSPDANALGATRRKLARQGVPVHVPSRSPVASQELAIGAANLPPRVEADSQTYLRAVLVNGRVGAGTGPASRPP